MIFKVVVKNFWASLGGHQKQNLSEEAIKNNLKFSQEYDWSLSVVDMHFSWRSGPVAWPHGYGGKSPHFCQDGAQDFFKVDEKIIGGGVANFQRSRRRCQEF